MITPDDILREARRIARKHVRGIMLVKALECINEDDIRILVSRKLATEPLPTEALRTAYMICIEPNQG